MTPRRLQIAFYVDSVPFTEDVIKGRTSLGGSESACLGLARALAARGHDVHIFATKLDDSSIGEHDGVLWHQAETQLVEACKFNIFDVFVSLRMPQVFMLEVPARLRVLWNQDLLIAPEQVNGALCGVDVIAYVSEFHRAQWEAREDPGVVAHIPYKWVVENGIDLGLVPSTDNSTQSQIDAAIDTGIMARAPRFIHVTRPERGVDALLALWPKIRAKYPFATLKLARYSSMYDAGGWGKICAAFDHKVQQMAKKVGGIEYLGELNKVDLYRAIAASHVMLYPTSDPSTFAETNCIAATEAQANGCVFVGSWHGALPETVHPEAGVLVEGRATDPATHDLWLAAIERALDPEFRATAIPRGREWASRCDFTTQAIRWEGLVAEAFADRFSKYPLQVMRRFLNDDNHVHALMVGRGLMASPKFEDFTEVEAKEIRDSIALCQRVISQEEQGPEAYAHFAIQDSEREADHSDRIRAAAGTLFQSIKDLPRPLVLDLACGNGAFAIALCKLHPGVHIIGLDYSKGVLKLASDAVARLGFNDRVYFTHGGPDDILKALDDAGVDRFDGAFCGEFLEHVEHPHLLIDKLDLAVKPGGRVILTTPSGPFSELLDRPTPRQRGHIHSFDLRDIECMFDPKAGFAWTFLYAGVSVKGNRCGYWLVGFDAGQGGPARSIDYYRRINTERPYSRVTCCMITRNCAGTIRAALDSLYGVDAVVAYDTSDPADDTPRIIESWSRAMPGDTSTPPRLTGITPTHVVRGQWPDDFSVARNRSMDAARDLGLLGPLDYVMWLDGDEVVHNLPRVWAFATGTGPFIGTGIRQWHVQLHQPNFFDKPVRLFRADKGVRFYGVVHEQPEITMDESILPTLLAEGLEIYHTGYVDHSLRRQKMQERNLPLLKKELGGVAAGSTHPTRILAYVLAMRDYVNLAMYRVDELGGTKLDSAALSMLKKAVAIYREHGFDDPVSRYHEVSWPFYQQALGIMARAGLEAYQVSWHFGMARGRIKDAVPQAETFWVESVAEGQSLLQHKVKRMSEPLVMPPLRLQPWDGAPGPWAVPPVLVDIKGAPIEPNVRHEPITPTEEDATATATAST